jgi:hypothetical protein
LASAGIALWALISIRAFLESDGFAKCRWQTIPFTTDSWETLSYLRAETPRTARVLAPFEPTRHKSGPPVYAISGIAGRRAVDEHFSLAMYMPELGKRMVERRQLVEQFYRDPQPERLRALTEAWELDYVVLPSSRVSRIPSEWGHAVFETPEWSVIRLRSP